MAVKNCAIVQDSERDIAGHTVNRKRACLNTESVNMLVFLAETFWTTAQKLLQNILQDLGWKRVNLFRH